MWVCMCLKHSVGELLALVVPIGCISLLLLHIGRIKYSIFFLLLISSKLLWLEIGHFCWIVLMAYKSICLLSKCNFFFIIIIILCYFLCFGGEKEKNNRKGALLWVGALWISLPFYFSVPHVIFESVFLLPPPPIFLPFL